MKNLAFIGLGNMGSGLAANQVKAGRLVDSISRTGRGFEFRDSNDAVTT